MRRRAAMWSLLLVSALALPALADDAREPSYADHPASWWIDEYLSGDNPQAARLVVEKMGDAAGPALVARLPELRGAEDRVKLLGLLGGLRTFPEGTVEALRKCLASSTPSEQAGALEVASRAGLGGALAADVAALLRSPRPQVRRAAISALGEMGEAAVPHVGELTEILGAGDGSADRGVLYALGKIGPAAAPALDRMLAVADGTPSDHVVAKALASVGPDDPRVTERIVRAVESADSGSLDLCTQILSQANPVGRAVADAAERLSGHAEPKVRAAAARALGGWGLVRHETPETLLRLAGDSEAQVAGSVATALDRIARQDPGPDLARRVVELWRTTRYPRTFRDVVVALRPHTSAAIVEAAVAPSADLRAVAWDILGRWGASDGAPALGRDEVARLLFDPRADARSRQGLARSLGGSRIVSAEDAEAVWCVLAREGEPFLADVAIPNLWKGDAAREALVAAARRVEPEVRRVAVRMLARHVGVSGEAVDACLERLDDEDASVVSAALESLQALHYDTWREPSALRDRIVSRLPAAAERGPEARARVLGLLSAFPDESRPPGPLVALLRHDDLAEQLLALFRRTGTDPSELLTAAMDDPDPVFAARAASVLAMRRPDHALVARLAACAESPDARIARPAVVALDSVKAELVSSVAGALIRVAKGGRQNIAGPACDALGKIAATDPLARDALLAVADDPSNTAQTYVILRLTDLGEPGLRRVVAFLDSPVREARRVACMAVASAARAAKGDVSAALPSLEKLAAGDDHEVAQIAQAAIEAIRARQKPAEPPR